MARQGKATPMPLKDSKPTNTQKFKLLEPLYIHSLESSRMYGPIVSRLIFMPNFFFSSAHRSLPTDQVECLCLFGTWWDPKNKNLDRDHEPSNPPYPISPCVVPSHPHPLPVPLSYSPSYSSPTLGSFHTLISCMAFSPSLSPSRTNPFSFARCNKQIKQYEVLMSFICWSG